MEEKRFLSGFQRVQYWTPDFVNINRSQWKFLPVFIYDNLRKGCRKSNILRDALYFGEAQSAIPHWMLKRTDDGNNVVGFALKAGGKTDRGVLCPRFENMTYLKGEIYAVPLRKLCELDRLHQNGHTFERTKEYFYLKDQPEETKNQIVEAFVYKGKQSYWAPTDDRQLWGRTDSAKIYTNMNWYSFYREIS